MYMSYAVIQPGNYFSNGLEELYKKQFNF